MRRKAQEGKTKLGTVRVVDAPTTDDMLGFAKFARPLSERVASATEENTPLTIGIYGEWGSGKTSFLMMIDKNLRERDIHPVWFNAWKYDQEDNLWAALIQTILDQAHVGGKWYRRAWIKARLWARQFSFRSGSWELTKALVSATIRLSVFLLATGLFLGWSLQDITQAINQTAGNLFPGNPVFVAIAVKATIAVAGIVAAKPEALLKLFDTKLGIDYSKLSRKRSYREHIAFLDQFNEEFESIIEQISFGTPLVVIIDDLDRCLPEKAIQVLEAIKLFLDVKNCVFLLAVDRDVIERAISVKYKDLIELLQKGNGSSPSLATFLGENYFEKIIQLPFSLPPIVTEDIEHLITQLSPDKDTNQFSRIFAIGLQRNPRKVKRVLQTFLFLRELADEGIREGAINLPLLAKLVILQSRFRSLYAEITDAPELLAKLDLYYRVVDEYRNNEHAQKASSLDDYVTDIGGIDPALKEKLEAYATEYPALRAILLHSTNEDDSFVKANVEDYIYFVKTISGADSQGTARPSDESEELIIRRYLRFLVETHRYFSAQGVTKESHLPLLSQIVGFTFRVHSQEVGHGDPALALERLVHRGSRNLILGAPGIGKTTLLQYLALIHADSILENNLAIIQQVGFSRSLLPILLPLRSLGDEFLTERNSTPATIVELIERNLDSWGISKTAIEIVLRYLERGQCLVLLDGVDEIPGDLRYSAAESINAFVARYSTNTYFITMRTHAFEQGIQLNGFDPYEILPWNEDQIHKFITNWYAESPEKADKLIAAITSSEELVSLSDIPLLLTILVSTFNSYGAVPAEREDLVAGLIDVVLGRWDQTRGIDLGYSVGELTQALAVIAKEMNNNYQNTIRRRDAIAIIKEATGQTRSDSTDLLKLLVARSGLLIENEINSYMFVHRLVQDYFANLSLDSE